MESCTARAGSAADNKAKRVGDARFDWTVGDPRHELSEFEYHVRVLHRPLQLSDIADASEW